MNHTYEETYKNARAMWVRHVFGFIISIDRINTFLNNKFGIPLIFGKREHKYIVYEAYTDDVNKHKKKLMDKVTPPISEFVFLLIKFVTSLY